MPRKNIKQPSRAAHMAERKASGQTTKQVAEEFGTSKTTAHRRMKGVEPMRQGFVKMGHAG